MTMLVSADPTLPPMTPRPAAVQGVQCPMLDLNGTWEFAPAGGAGFKPIHVPGEWAMQGFTVEKGAFAIYRRQIDIPADWQGMTIKLCFDAVHAVCKVLLNGVEIGGHEGGFVPFELDATTAIKPGRNDLIVRVQSESTADAIACMNQYAAHQVGGILRKVGMFCVPVPHIANLEHGTRVNGTDAELTVRADIGGLAAGQGGMIAPQHRLLDADNAIVTTCANGEVMRIPKARLWTSETPYLYTLESILGHPDKPKEIVRRKIGLREIAVSGNRLWINGKPVKLLGMNRHEVHPLRGRSLTPDLCRKDAELFRAANVNLVRTSHYPPGEEFLGACDELGIFVECEAAICWINHPASPIWKTWNHHDPQYLPYFLRANLDNVAANRHHPSVIIWSLANESMWSPLFAGVLAAVKEADPSRPVTFHDQCWGKFNNAGSTTTDIANYHYPDESDPGEWSKLQRPVWFGEYAHLQAYNRRELVTDPGIRADWGRPLARMVDLIWDQPGCLGGAIWSGIDDVFHMPDGDLKGYGHWGPIDGWRREKPEYHGVFTAYSPVRILKREFEHGKPIVLTVQNRFNFTNMNALEVRWSVPGAVRSLRPEAVPPGGIGTIILPTGDLPDDYNVNVVITDPRGVIVARECFRTPPKPDGTTTNSAAAIALDGNTIRLGAGGAFAIPAPVPMVLPLNGDGGASGPAGSVLANHIEPFTPLPASWDPSVTLAGNTCTIAGDTDDGHAEISMTGMATGEIAVAYEFKLLKDIHPRQWGLVFTLPRGFDTLAWECTADATWYPDDHIARPRGLAKANPVAREFVEEPGVPPAHAWARDANALGTADFRSTKWHVVQASLSDGKSSFVIRSGDASQAVRAWVDGDAIRLLVAGFNTGGSDGFFAPHYAAERRPLKAGDVIRAAFTFHLPPL